MNSFSWYLWCAVIAGEVALSARMVIAGSWRRWPSLLSFLVLLSVRDLVRVGGTFLWRNPGIEFYSYWSASLLAECVEVWIVVQIGLELGGCFLWLRRMIAHGLPALAAIILAVCFALAFRQGSAPLYTRLSLGLEQAISFTVLATFVLGVFLPSESIGLDWSGLRGFTVGLVVEITSARWVDVIFLRKSLDPTFLYHIKSGLFLVSLGVWALSTGRAGETVNNKDDSYATVYNRALVGAEGIDTK